MRSGHASGYPECTGGANGRTHIPEMLDERPSTSPVFERPKTERKVNSTPADGTVIYLDNVGTGMGTGLQTPSFRECERCGRSEHWDEDDETWRIREEDDERQVGNPHCIHEWNITGSFSPFKN